MNITKKPTKKGQKISVLGDCIPCKGRGWREYGDCDRGCCGNMVKTECDYCNGLGKKNYKYIAVLSWETRGSTSLKGKEKQ